MNNEIEIIKKARSNMLQTESSGEKANPKHHLAKKLKGFVFYKGFPYTAIKQSDDKDKDLNEIRALMRKEKFDEIPSRVRHVMKFKNRNFPEIYYIKSYPSSTEEGKTRIAFEMHDDSYD